MDEPMTPEAASEVAAARGRLLAARDDGRLDELATRHHVRVLTLFGSAAQEGDHQPRDLDVGVSFEPGDAVGDLLALGEALVELVGTDRVDLLDVRRASPVARARALAHGAVPLFESEAGAYATAQMGALGLEMELATMRRAQLRGMAGR